MKMEPTVSSETSAIRNETPENYPKRNKLQYESSIDLNYNFDENSWRHCFLTAPSDNMYSSLYSAGKRS